MGFIREHIVKRIGRSKGWSKLRKEYVRNNPTCEACGRSEKLEVHHILPVHEYPDFELDYSNLVTLCGGSTKCHFVFGHLGNYKWSNGSVLSDANRFLEKRESCGQIKDR